MHDKVQVSREVSLVYSTVARVYKHVRRASAFGQRHILPPSALLTVTSFEQPLGQVLWHDESLLVPACQPWSTEAEIYVGNTAPMSGTVLPIRPIGRNCPYLPPWVASLS